MSNAKPIPESQKAETVSLLRKRLLEMDAEIAEAERRLPAHSVKPLTMQTLLDLEDERDALRARLDAMETPSR